VLEEYVRHAGHLDIAVELARASSTEAGASVEQQDRR
jgi:hypothetical protein